MIRSLSAIPYQPAANWTAAASGIKKRLIVIHAMEYPEKPDSAEWCSRYFAGLEGPAPKASAHACIDQDSVIQCVPWDQIAWHAPGANTWGIGLEHAGFGRFSLADWQTTYSLQMLDLSAWVCAELCTLFAIPVDFLDANELAAAGENARGITTHAEVSKAFKKSDHSDPGKGFPMGDYLRAVGKYALDANGPEAA